MPILGYDAKLYRNTGNYAAPTWQEVTNVRDLDLRLEAGEADVTTRQAAGWRCTIGGLKEVTIEFEMLWDTSDEDFQALRDAWLNGTTVDVQALDGPSDQSGSQGLRATCAVTRFAPNQALEDVVKVGVTLKPAEPSQPPQWVTVP